jgi:hypothetical protein
MTRRPIDVLRNSGKSITIQDDSDPSAITDMIPVGGRLALIKAHSIHAIQLADQIDPDRTNAAIPDTQQRILFVGAEDPIVARTLLTARTLFKKSLIGPSFDEAKGLTLAFELLKDIDSLNKMRDDLDVAQNRAEGSFNMLQGEQRSLCLPSIVNIKERVDAFAQKAGHVVNTLEDIAKLFYGEKLAKKWVDSLVVIFERQHGSNAEHLEFLKSIRDFLLLVLGFRNMIEHPLPERHVTVLDYRLLPNGTIDRPSIQIMKPGEKVASAPVVMLIEHWTEQLVIAAEGLMALLCGVAVQSFAGVPVSVVELPVDQRPNKHQRMFYGCFYGQRIIRFG